MPLKCSICGKWYTVHGGTGDLVPTCQCAFFGDTVRDEESCTGSMATHHEGCACHENRRDAEMERLKTELADIKESFARTVSEDCARDEKHCSCVPALRAEIARLKDQLRWRKWPEEKPPADLKPILVRYVNIRNEARWYQAKYTGPNSFWNNELGFLTEDAVTHWLPIPPMEEE